MHFALPSAAALALRTFEYVAGSGQSGQGVHLRQEDSHLSVLVLHRNRLPSHPVVGDSVDNSTLVHSDGLHQLPHLFHRARQWEKLHQQQQQQRQQDLHRQRHPAAQSAHHHVRHLLRPQLSLVHPRHLRLQRLRPPRHLLRNSVARACSHHPQPRHLRVQIPTVPEVFQENGQRCLLLQTVHSQITVQLHLRCTILSNYLSFKNKKSEPFPIYSPRFTPHIHI